MKIIIPMSGQGERFVNAGYKKIKPLIEVDGKPIIEHVIDLFPGEENFIFICNKEHLEKTELRQVLESKAPKGKIIAIEKHKFGPVYAVLKAQEQIEDEEQVIVNYCDFNAYWDYSAFKSKVNETKCDGAVSSYTGLHPHLLWKNKYAGMRVDKDNWMLEIKEKHSFTKNPVDSYHSAGTYYFGKGKFVKQYFMKLMEKQMTVNNEYYVSSVYELMLRDNLKVLSYELDFFLQWGTPSDLEEYKLWSAYFLNKEPDKIKLKEKTTVLVPMAGKGQRFIDEGYKEPKPLIEVSGKPMFMHAVDSFPEADEYVFICSKDHVEGSRIDEEIKKYVPNAKIVVPEKHTEGQAASCMLGEKLIDPESELIIASCDNKMIFDGETYEKLLNDKAVDAFLWTFRKNPAVNRNPEAYAYVQVNNGKVEKVSCKKTISSNPINDHAITGAFYFRRAGEFFDYTRKMIEKNIRVNNEFYVDLVPNEFLENGKEARVFDVASYLVFGTPQDLMVYKYWEKYFKIKKESGI